jgi:hypothetical protein
MLAEYDCFPMSDLGRVQREEVEAARKARSANRPDDESRDNR